MPGPNDRSGLAGKFVVLGVTSSIAAYKAAGLCRRLREDGAEVRVVMTPDAVEFIAPLTFETLSAAPVTVDLFEDDAWPVPSHIELGGKADLVAIVPASADFIGRLAAGLADTALGAVVMATRAPVLVAPAMNSRMYASPILEANIERLKGFGFHFVGPASGRLACGTEGPGRLADPDEIFARMVSLLGA